MPDSLRRARTPSPRRGLRDRGLTGLGLVVVLAMMLGGGIVVRQGRLDAWQAANHASDHLRLALTRDIARNLALVDLAIQGTARALASPGIDEASPEIRRQALFAAAATAEDLGAVLVLDAAGRVVEGAPAAVPHNEDLADRDEFRIHKERADAGLVVGRPFRSLAAGGDARLTLSRRRPPAPDGSFAGVIQASLRIASFRRLFDPLDLGPRGTLSLFRDDGRLVYHYPQRDMDLDHDASEAPMFQRAVADEHGSFVARARTDGVERLYSFGRVPGLPLILTVGRATDDIYAAWWRRTLLAAPFRLLLCVTAIASTLLFSREIRRRRAAEAALEAAAEELEALATTDELTGIANRRAFNAELDGEWRRSIRSHGPMAMLMIDVDLFKPFNDRYGHLRGDQALRAVAAAIRSGVRRPADLPARTGGEEFSALLPETDLAGARRVAEQIRSSVEALAIPHADGIDGRLTVSIGVAVSRPVPGDAVRDLLQSADTALYAAKRAGRNRIAVPAGPADAARSAEAQTTA